jgi:hypothetical protein
LLQTLQNKNLAKPKQNNFVKKLLQIWPMSNCRHYWYY